MAPWVIFHNNTRIPPAPPWHDKEDMLQRLNEQRSSHHSRHCTNKGLGHIKETTPPSLPQEIPTSQDGLLASPSDFQTDPTIYQTITTIKAKGTSRSSCLQFIIQWSTMKRSDSMRNSRVFKTPSPGTPNSYPFRMSTPTSASNQRCSVT